MKNFNKLKTPESYIKYGVEGYSFREVIDNIEDEDIIDSMLEMQVDAYNQAIEDANEILMNTTPNQLWNAIQEIRNFKIKK